MTLCELVFILLFLGSVISLFLSAFLRRRGGSRKILIAMASVWGVYLVILAITDVLSSQKIFKPGVEQCFDEMCFAVADAQTMPAQTFDPSVPTASTLYVVKVRVTSHSRGRAQEVPQGIVHPALTLDHGFTPGYFVMGESPFFHKPDIHRLPNDL